MKKPRKTYKKNPPLPTLPPAVGTAALGAATAPPKHPRKTTTRTPHLPDPIVPLQLQRSQIQDLYALVESRVRVCNQEGLFGRPEDRAEWSEQARKWDTLSKELLNALQEAKL